MNEAASGGALRERLATWLEGGRSCLDRRWLQAVREVPREVLVPEGEPLPTTEWEEAAVEAACSWTEVCNLDVTIVTRKDERGGYTSSSTMPSIVTAMLELLQVEDDNRVLEIGTGTGYSTALLCHRLGAGNVTTIDHQADLVALAWKRLGTLGYEPRTIPGDGALGVPEGAPYDRLIGTAFSWPIPSAWVQQVRPGGRIVAVVPAGVVALEVGQDGSASGHFTGTWYEFMPLVGTTRIPWSEFDAANAPEEPTTRPWRHPPSILGAGAWNLPFGLLVNIKVLPGSPTAWDHTLPAREWEVDLSDVDGSSRALIVEGSRDVQQGGRRRLWDEIEQLYDKWCELGAPARERFGLTVTPDGRHTLWLDDPDSEHRWDVTPATAAAL